MAVDKSLPGLVFTKRRIPNERQEQALRAAGAQHIMYVGQQCDSWRDVAQITREGDTVFIFALTLLPTPRGKDKLSPTAQIADAVSEFMSRKAVLVEVYTGRRSDNSAQRRAMINDAVKVLRIGRHTLPKGFAPVGRVAAEFSKEQRAEAKRIWKSRDYVTNSAAENHMPTTLVNGREVRFTVHRARRLWGPSGRPWKKRKPKSE